MAAINAYSLPVPPALAVVSELLVLRCGLASSGAGGASPAVRADWRTGLLSFSFLLFFCDAAAALLALAEALLPLAVGAVQVWVVARAASSSSGGSLPPPVESAPS